MWFKEGCLARQWWRDVQNILKRRKWVTWEEAGAIVGYSAWKHVQLKVVAVLTHKRQLYNLGGEHHHLTAKDDGHHDCSSADM